MANRLNLVGKKFGRLTVISYAGRDKWRFSQWLCKCDCGKETIVLITSLRSGHTQSCGCLQKQRSSEALKGTKRSKEIKQKISEAHKGVDNPNYKHGLTNTKEYINQCSSKHRSRKLNQTPDNASMVEI